MNNIVRYVLLIMIPPIVMLYLVTSFIRFSFDLSILSEQQRTEYLCILFILYIIWGGIICIIELYKII
jgi:hypothetical protein